MSGRSIRDINEEYSSEVAEVERRYGRKKAVPDNAQSEVEYQKVRRRLLFDTLFIGALWICGTWTFGDVASAESALLGVIASIMYVLLLSPDTSQLENGDILATGKNKQPVRFLLLPLVVLGIAKSHGALHVIPAVVGFFSYKVALLLPLLSGEAFVNK